MDTVGLKLYLFHFNRVDNTQYYVEEYRLKYRS